MPIRTADGPEGASGDKLHRRVVRTMLTGHEGYPIFQAEDGFFIEIAVDTDAWYSPRAAGWPDGHGGYQLTELWEAIPSSAEEA